MTSAENIALTDGVGALAGGANVGVNLNGGTVTVSGVKTVAALFVQSDTTLDFSGDSSSRLDISGPLYVADGKTLTIKLGTLSNGYRMPITMGSCFASDNQVVLNYETPAGSTSTPVVSGTSIKVFTENEDAEAITISDYTPWSYAKDVFTWISPSSATGNDVDLWKYIKFDVSTGQNAGGATAIEGGNNTAYDTAATPSKKFWWYWCYSGNANFPGYSAPGLVARFLPDDNENTYLKKIPAGFGPLTIGGLIVEAGARGYSFENSADTRWTTLGDPTGQAETRFTILEDFAINRNGGLNLVGTSYFDIAAGKVFSLNAGRADDQQPVMRATVGAAADSGKITSGIVDGGCLKMHGEGQIVATKLTASSACLDYSDLSASRGVPYIDAQLVVDSNTSYKFPALAGAATYQLARRLVDTSGVTGDQIFSIDGHEYKAPLSFNDASGTAVFPAVATVNGSGSEVDWSAITWDATPATIGSSDVVTLNITGNTTLDFNTTISIGKLVLNISEGAELSLSNLANLTAANGIVLRGAGTLKIDAATTISHPITVDGNVSILFEGNAAALTISGTLTINAGKTLYVAAANWTTPALAGVRDVLTATTLTNNGTITMGAITGDMGRDYTASVADNKVSVMRMTAETFAYDTYPDGGSATGWATSWGENFDTNQLRVGPSSAYPYAYYTTSSAHPYQGTLSNRGDSISFSIYADLSQTPSTGKAVIVGFGGAGTANNKLLLLYREESTVKWAVVDRGPDEGTTAVLGTAASVTLPAGGYHLYTGTFDKTTGNLQLFLDNESAVAGTSAGDTTIAGGMQIGNAFQGVGTFKGAHGFVMGTNAAIVAMRGYNAILGAEEVGVLAGRYPATTGAIDREIKPKIAGKTLTVYSSSEGATGYTFGPDAGNVVIAAGNTVNVTTFRTYPSGSTDGSDNAVTINGTLNVSQSDSTIGDDANKGVVIGYWLKATSGTRKTSVTVPSGGTLDASNAYILIPHDGDVQEATLNITGGTVKTKGLYGNDTAGVTTGKVVLRDNGVLEVATIPSVGKAITKEFKHGTFRVKADAEETRAINFSAAGGDATTLDPDGHTLTMSSAAMTGAGAVTVGGSNGGTVVFSGFTSAYTGALTINDANKDMVSVTTWDNFKGTLNYAVTDGTLDLTSYSIDSAAIINVTGSGATVKLKTGPTVNVSSGATAQLYVSESVYKYDGFIYKGASSGTVEYYQGEMPTKVTSEYMNGANLLPYYSIFQGHADGDNYVGNLATPSDWKNGTDDGFVVPTTRNAAIYVPDGKTLTVTIDNTSTFGEVQLYTDPSATYGGTVVFKKGESGSMTVSSVMCVTKMTALKIDDDDPGVAFGSGAEINLVSGTMVTFNATNYSAPKITGSGNMVVNASKAVTFTGNANAATVIVNGSATVSSGKLTATSLTVDGTLNIGGNTLAATTLDVSGVANVTVSSSGSLNLTSASGEGTVTWTGLQPNSNVWNTSATWSGTNVVMSSGTTEIANLTPEQWGRNGSYIVMKNLKGYIATADNGVINGEVILQNGDNGYALSVNNGWAGRTTYFRKISGSGDILDAHQIASTKTGGAQQFVFKDASDFTGSVIIDTTTSGNHHTKRFTFSNSSYDSASNESVYGVIKVLSDGSAVIGDGKTWKVDHGISIAGTVTLKGAATMASATTIASGATLVFQDGASLAFTAASSPVTLPAEGTVKINANAMTLTSEGATIITSTTEFTDSDVAKLKSVGHHVFKLDAKDAKKINVYPAVAKVGDTYYTDLATAEAAFAADETVQHFEVYSGTVTGSYHSLGMVDSVTTYRKQNQNVYYQTGKYWSSSTGDLFKLDDGTVTAAYAGDTIVIDSASTGDFWADPANAVAATDISVQRSVTIKQGAGSGNLFDGKAFTIADGATLTISGASRAVTLGAVTFDKAAATGAVTLDGGTNAITLGGNLSGSAPATITGTVIATGKTIANTLKNTTGGTVVYDGNLPGTVPTFDSSWTGTVWLKNYTSLTGSVKQGDTVTGTTSFDPNRYGNENSTVKFTGVKGYLQASNDGSYTIEPALELVDDGDNPGLLLYNGWGYNKQDNAACYTIIRELKGTGTLKADTTLNDSNAIPGLNVLLLVQNWGNFTGTLNMPNKNVAFGSTPPAQSVAEGGGKIFVRSGSISIPSTKTWTCVTNFVESGASMVLPNNSALTGTIAGGGTIECDGFQPSLTLASASGWTGTLWIKNIGTEGETTKVGTKLGNGTDSVDNTSAQSWGNANSFVKFTNVRGYMARANCPWTLILEDDASGNKAWYNNNGWASTFATFKALKGSGTFYNHHPTGVANVCKQKITFTSANEFTGTIYADGMRIGIGGESTQENDDATGRGTIEIKADTTASIAAGNTWTTYSTTGFIVNGALSVANGGALSGKIAGGGTITYAAVPASALTFGTWTGTIELPSFGAGGEDLNNYGVTNSKVKLNGVTNGYFGMGTEGSEYTINPEIVLAGNLVLTDSSTRTWRFTKISGSGNFSLTPGAGNYNITVNATKMTDYTGTIVNNMGTAFTVDELALATAPASGTKILSTGGTGTVTLSTVTVGGNAATFGVKKGDDGYYAGYASTTTGEGGGAVTTVDASSEVSEVTVAVPASYSGKVVIPANVKKLTITGETVSAANIGLKAPYAGNADNIYYGIVNIGEGNVVSLNGEATVGGVKVQPEVKTGNSITPMAMGASTPRFKVKTIPGLYYAVKAASSIGDLAGNYKYGEPVQATSSSIDSLEAPTFPGTVIYYQIDAGLSGDDLTKYIISQRRLANTPTEDGIFTYGETGWNRDVYRIPAMAATPDGQVVMGIFDARYNYQDLGVRLTSEGYNADTASPDHYTGIDIGGVFSLDGGENWSYPHIMIDVPNASDPKTGTKTTTLTKAMELGDPCIVYDSANSKFIMMGITGGGLTTPTNTTSNAILADVVMYECTLASVKSGNPTWVGPVSVKAAIETALQTADTAANNFTYPSSFTGDGYLGILEGPGHAFVTRAACGDIPANTVVWPMQYVIRQGGRWTLKGGNFAAWKDGSGSWHTTKLVPNSGDGHNYVTQEGCITQLDNGDLLYMCKKIGGGSRPFYKSTDGVNWTFLNEITIAGSEAHQGSILRLGSGSDGHSRYAAVFATGTLRSDIKAFIGTDDGSGSVTWDTENPITVWAGATGTADNDGNGPHGNLVYGYNSLVMLDETTLGVLSEAHGHIYFTKIDVSSALK